MNLLCRCTKMAQKSPGIMLFESDLELEFVEYLSKDGSKGSRYYVL